MADKKKKETPYVPFKGSKAAETYKTYEEYRAAINDKYKAGQAGTKLADWKPGPTTKEGTRVTPSPDYNKSGGRGTNTGMYGTVLPPASSSYLTNPNKVGRSQTPMPLGQTFGIPPEALAPSINASAKGRVTSKGPAGLTPGQQSSERARRNAGLLGRQGLAAGSALAGATAGTARSEWSQGTEEIGETAGESRDLYRKTTWDIINALIQALNG